MHGSDFPRLRAPGWVVVRHRSGKSRPGPLFGEYSEVKTKFDRLGFLIPNFRSGTAIVSPGLLRLDGERDRWVMLMGHSLFEASEDSVTTNLDSSRYCRPSDCERQIDPTGVQIVQPQALPDPQPSWRRQRPGHKYKEETRKFIRACKAATGKQIVDDEPGMWDTTEESRQDSTVSTALVLRKARQGNN